MANLKINNCDFEKYKIFINNNEVKEQDELDNSLIDSHENILKIIQKNIIDLFYGKSLWYKVLFGFIIVITEGIGGSVLNQSVIGAGYSRAKYTAMIVPKGNKEINIDIQLKQKKILFIPIGKYNFDIKSNSGELKDINIDNNSNNEDKFIWYTIFLIPIAITIVALVIAIISVYKNI